MILENFLELKITFVYYAQNIGMEYLFNEQYSVRRVQ